MVIFHGFVKLPECTPSNVLSIFIPLLLSHWEMHIVWSYGIGLLGMPQPKNDIQLVGYVTICSLRKDSAYKRQCGRYCISRTSTIYLYLPSLA